MKKTGKAYQNYNNDLHHFLDQSSDFSFLLDSAFNIICVSDTTKNFFADEGKAIVGLSFFELITKYSSSSHGFLNELESSNWCIKKKIDLKANNITHNVIFYFLKFFIQVDSSQSFFLVNGLINNQNDSTYLSPQKKSKEWDLATILRTDSTGVPTTFFRSFIAGMPGIIFWKDTNSVYKGCNSTFLDLCGFKSVDEVIGLTDEDIGRRLNWDLESINQFRKDDQEVISRKKTLIFEDSVTFSDEKDKVLLDTKAPIFNENNEVIGVFGIAQDITEHRQREVALKNAKEAAEKAQELSAELDAIIRYAPDFIYWKDRNSVHLGCNQRFADFTGLESTEAVVGKTDFEFPWKDQAKSFQKDDADVIQSGKPKLNIEDIMVDSKGRVAIVITNKVPLRTPDGKIIGILGIATEITKLKETQDKLRNALLRAESANKAKSEFIANMSHDLRTPMTGVLGMLEQLKFAIEDGKKVIESKKQALPPEFQSIFNDLLAKAEEYTNFAKLSSNELVNLFNEILETVRLESGEFKEKSVTFDLYNLIQKNIDLLKSVANHKQLTLSFNIDDNVPNYFEGISLFVDRCLSNLLSNALKFTDKGSVTIHVSAPDATENMAVGNEIMLHIAVQDTGIGIPADKFDTIFEHFSRLTSSYRGVYKGSGLGLYAVKKYLEALNGRITLISEVGKGSCFTLIIPLKIGDVAEVIDDEEEQEEVITPASITKVESATPTVTKESIASDKNKARILLVEDHPLVALATRSLLERFGCVVDVAATGSQAVEQASKHHYDLIFMDVGLPDFEGTEATRRIRKLSDTAQSQVPIVALTGHSGDAEKRQECFDAGMEAVLSKPPQESVIEQTLAKWVWQPDTDTETTKSSAAESSSESSEIALLPLINWQGSLERFNNDREMLMDLLAKMPASLKESQAILAEAYKSKDTKALRAEIHRMLGAVVFFDLPRVKQVTVAFQTAVKAVPQDTQALESTYRDFNQTIDAFCEAYKRNKLEED